MATTIQKLTYDVLASIVTERESDRIELIDGVAYVTPAPRPVHQLIVTNLIGILLPVIRGRRLGMLYASPVDVRLSAHDLVQPDLLFIARDRLSIMTDVAIEGPPDLVVEILSPGTRERDLGAKRDLYARAGVREYWVIDPEARTIAMLGLYDGRYEAIPADAAELVQSALLPGLAVDPAAVFDLE
jgi:Uma2 family endonuclease